MLLLRSTREPTTTEKSRGSSGVVGVGGLNRFIATQDSSQEFECLTFEDGIGASDFDRKRVRLAATTRHEVQWVGTIHRDDDHYGGVNTLFGRHSTVGRDGTDRVGGAAQAKRQRLTPCLGFG